MSSEDERARELAKQLRIPLVTCLLSDSARHWRGCAPDCTCPESYELGILKAALRQARDEATKAENERLAQHFEQSTIGSSMLRLSIASAIRARITK